MWKKAITMLGHDRREGRREERQAFSPLRERYSIDVPGRSELVAQGNIADHEFEIESDATTG